MILKVHVGETGHAVVESLLGVEELRYVFIDGLVLVLITESSIQDSLAA